MFEKRKSNKKESFREDVSAKAQNEEVLQEDQMILDREGNMNDHMSGIDKKDCKSPYWDVRMTIASKTSSQKILKMLSRDSHPTVRITALLNASTTEDIIWNVIKDPVLGDDGIKYMIAYSPKGTEEMRKYLEGEEK